MVLGTRVPGRVGRRRISYDERRLRPPLVLASCWATGRLERCSATRHRCRPLVVGSTPELGLARVPHVSPPPEAPAAPRRPSRLQVWHASSMGAQQRRSFRAASGGSSSVGVDRRKTVRQAALAGGRRTASDRRDAPPRRSGRRGDRDRGARCRLRSPSCGSTKAAATGLVGRSVAAPAAVPLRSASMRRRWKASSVPLVLRASSSASGRRPRRSPASATARLDGSPRRLRRRSRTSPRLASCSV